MLSSEGKILISDRRMLRAEGGIMIAEGKD
jgi:hypothetical protein